MLRYQLNPHFLFNTLNSISTLVLLKQTERANAMLSRLSSFLRYTLVNEPTAQGHAGAGGRDAEALSRDREDALRGAAAAAFPDRSEAIGARLPSLLLQPLIENAIKYAVTPSEEGADIWITAHARGPGGADRSRRQRQRRRARDFARQPVDRRRPGEHSGPSGAGLWRGHRFRDQNRTNEGASALSSKFPIETGDEEPE